ncbi:MAG: biopolymer transporter ExbD [Candidatus Cloacimonetes bacterium]|nr:biopolymer transporter ExbD [Candidatus Cloacimonadota bacterium]
MALMRKKGGRASGEIPTSSMADIAFLLLVFFLVTTVFDEERGLPIVLPEQGEEQEVSQRNVLHLTVLEDGTVEVKRGESPTVQRVSARDVAGIWRLGFQQNPNLIAAVKTAPNAPYRNMVAVLDQLQTAGAERISLQILE